MKSLAFYKTILEKVSFNPSLFFKEYKKAYFVLGELDRKRLKKWMLNKIKSNHKLYLESIEVFNYKIVGDTI